MLSASPWTYRPIWLRLRSNTAHGTKNSYRLRDHPADEQSYRENPTHGRDGNAGSDSSYWQDCTSSTSRRVLLNDG